VRVTTPLPRGAPVLAAPAPLSPQLPLALVQAGAGREEGVPANAAITRCASVHRPSTAPSIIRAALVPAGAATQADSASANPLALRAPVLTAPVPPLPRPRLSKPDQPGKHELRWSTPLAQGASCPPHQHRHFYHLIAALVQTGAATEAGSASDNAAPTGCTSARDTSTANIITTAALVQAGAAPRQEVRLLTPLPRGTPVPTARALPLPHQSCACSSKGSHESRKCVCQPRSH
jgi:hypothetical protein